MDWDQLNELKNQRKRERLQASEDVFAQAVRLARESGSCSLERMPARYHFQLVCFGENHDHIYNLYPTTQKIHLDPRHKGPFIRVTKPWTVLDVVKMVVKK